MKNIIRAISLICIVVGFISVVGTCGACTNGDIGLVQTIFQAVIALAITSIGFGGFKLTDPEF